MATKEEKLGMLVNADLVLDFLKTLSKHIDIHTIPKTKKTIRPMLVLINKYKQSSWAIPITQEDYEKLAIHNKG
jgi:hypothetical protein